MHIETHMKALENYFLPKMIAFCLDITLPTLNMDTGKKNVG